MRRRRILWHSDAPWTTSAYSGQTRLVCESLRSAGFEVLLSAASVPRGGTTTWNGFVVLPSPSHIERSLTRWMADLVDPANGDVIVTLIDPWRLAWQELAGWNVLSWTAIDCDPLPAAVAEHFTATKSRPAAVSSFGAGKFREAGFDEVIEIPHGIDLRSFRMLIDGDRAGSRERARQLVGLDVDAFVIGVVAANNDSAFNRKSLPELLAAVARYAAGGADVTLHLHTDLKGLEDGVDLAPILDRPFSPLGGRVDVVSTDATSYQRGLSEADMAIVYNAFDILLAPSGGEGFCLPLLEAQACGVPVVASDFAAQPENVGVGRLVGGQRRWDHERETFLFTPSVEGIVDALDDLRVVGPAESSLAVDFAAGRSHERVFDTIWLPLLADGAGS